MPACAQNHNQAPAPAPECPQSTPGSRPRVPAILRANNGTILQMQRHPRQATCAISQTTPRTRTQLVARESGDGRRMGKKAAREVAPRWSWRLQPPVAPPKATRHGPAQQNLRAKQRKNKNKLQVLCPFTPKISSNRPPQKRCS